jgi:glycerol-3-phosphate acyltransferase PlsY
VQSILAVLSVVLAYALGSIPFGVLIVRFSTGMDLRGQHSGRTGGTNAMRTAGTWAGVGTALADALKGAGAVWLARGLTGGLPWVEVLAGLAAVLGHNYSIFLIERRDGVFRLHGGAGGAPTVGAACGLWLPSPLIVVPLCLLVLIGIGYASVATMSAGVIITASFIWAAGAKYIPREFIAFGPLVEILLVVALLPNIRRLLDGTERIVGWRARKGRGPSEPV